MNEVRHSQKCTASPMWPMQIRSLGNRSNNPEAIMRTACVPTSTPYAHIAESIP